MRSNTGRIGAAKGTSYKKIKRIIKSLLQVIRKGVPLTASMTLEASIALPLFLFFFANILMLFNIVKIQCDIEAALHQTGSEMMLLAFDEKNAEQFIGAENTGLSTAVGAVSTLYAKNNVENYLGEELKKGIVSDGEISFLSSRILQGNDYIDIVAAYKVKPMIPIVGFNEFPVEGRFFGHAWTGYDLEGEQGECSFEEEMVYVTEHGEVYHRDINCKYLKLSTRSIDFDGIKNARNEDGSKYYPCEYCGQQVKRGNVFITDYGNRYHSKVDCPGLKRKIYTIPISEVGGRHPCSGCG
ncbi:hypothetical protein [Butyrivibrio proteoclasticus]|nr:hypothetical protein [Butyrivibrio proteoclasticus]